VGGGANIAREHVKAEGFDAGYAIQVHDHLTGGGGRPSNCVEDLAGARTVQLAVKPESVRPLDEPSVKPETSHMTQS
jgi:hypothetical protein